MEPSPRRSALIVLVTLVAALFSPIDFSILEPALPAIQRTFAVNERNISWAYAIFTMALMIGAPLIAKWSDQYGLRRAFGLTTVIFACGTLVCALAPSYLILIAGRAIQGFGAGGYGPLISVVIGDYVPHRHRGAVLSTLGVVVGIGLLAGPVVGSLALQIGWQTLFLGFTPAILALGAFGYALMPPARRPPKPFDFRGLVLLGLTVASFIYTSVQIRPNDFLGSLASVSVLPFGLAPLVFLYLLIRFEGRTANPLIPITMFRKRQIALASSLAIGYGFTRTALAFLPELASAAFREPITDRVALLLPITLAIILASLAGGVLVDRIGTKRVVITGLGVLTLGILLFALFPADRLVFLSAGVLCGVGSAVLIGAPVRYMFLNEFPADERGAGQGLFAVMWALGQQVSGIVIGSLLAARGGGLSGYSTAYLVIAAVLVVLLLAASGLKGRAEEQQKIG